jgi:hypothetical protein
MKDEVRTNWIRIGTIVSFILGSGLGAWLYLELGLKCFLFSAVISAYAAIHGKKAKIHAHKFKVL